MRQNNDPICECEHRLSKHRVSDEGSGTSCDGCKCSRFSSMGRSVTRGLARAAANGAKSRMAKVLDAALSGVEKCAG